MKDAKQIARELWQFDNDSLFTPLTPEWWVALGDKVHALIDEALMTTATTLVETELGGTEVPAPELSAAGDGVGPHAAAHRTMCSRRAQFPNAVLLDRRFRPSMFGYTAENFAVDYPTLDGPETLELFLTHHIANGTLSKNWLEKFWHYAKTGQNMKAERNKGQRETDSMGFPLDRKDRIRQQREQHAAWLKQDAYLKAQMVEQDSLPETSE